MALRHRRVSRIVVVDENQCVLLFHTSTPKLVTPTTRWITPGGGVDDHETHHEGALRELYEETGIVAERLEGPIHTITATAELASGDHQTSYAEFFVYRTTRFEVSRENWLDYEHEEIKAVDWFTLDQLVAGELAYAPAALPEIIRLALTR